MSARPRRSRTIADPRHDGLPASVGLITHRLIAELCRETRGADAARPFDPEWLWQTAGAITAAAGLGFQTRGARLVAVSHAAVFAQRLLPPPAWRFIGGEFDAGDGKRVDGAWESAEGLLFDELKLVVRAAAGGGPTGRQVARYAESGERLAVRLGRPFLGVRLIYLSAPRQSRLIRPAGFDTSLAETRYWFESCGRQEPGVGR